MDYIALIHQLIDDILNNPEKVKIEQIEGSSEKDTGRLIGKHGSTADALREVLSIAGKNNNQRIHIKLATLPEEN